MTFYYMGGVPLDRRRPAVVLVHGAGMDHTVWRYQSRYLGAHGFAVMAVDLPGHGKSAGPSLLSVEEMAVSVLATVEEAGITNFSLLGHSMGAYIGLEMAAARPQLVERMVLMGVSDEMKVHSDLQEAAERGQPLATDLIVSWSYGTEGRLGGHPQPGIWQPALTRRLLESGLDNNLAGDLAACSHYQPLAVAPRVVCPVLVLNGDADRMTAIAGARRLVEVLPNGDLEIVAGAGHMVMSEQPERTRQLLDGFLPGPAGLAGNLRGGG